MTRYLLQNYVVSLHSICTTKIIYNTSQMTPVVEAEKPSLQRQGELVENRYLSAGDY